MIRTVFLILCLGNQAAIGQIKLYVTGGVTNSTFGYRQSNSNTSYHTAASPILTAFGSVDIVKPLTSRLQLSARLAYATKGTHLSGTDYSTLDERNISINYVSIPIGIGYKLSERKNTGLAMILGLYGAFAVSGVEKGAYQFQNNPTSAIYNNIRIRSDNPNQVSPTNITPFDWGLSGSLIYNLSRMRLGLHYDIGLKGVMTNPALYDKHYFNSNLSAMIGYEIFSFQKR